VEAIALTATVWPALTDPAALANAPPSIEYSPFSMLIGTAISMPATATASEVAHTPRVASTLGSNSNPSGVVSGSRVVAANEADTPPTVSTALTEVENSPDVVSRTRIRWLLATEPAAAVKAPPSIEYSPPVIETGALELIPEMTISFDVTPTDNAVPDWAAKENGFGVVSAAGGGGGVCDPPPPPPPQPANKTDRQNAPKNALSRPMPAAPHFF
jgi:hypothetical protein